VLLPVFSVLMLISLPDWLGVPVGLAPFKGVHKSGDGPGSEVQNESLPLAVTVQMDLTPGGEGTCPTSPSSSPGTGNLEVPVVPIENFGSEDECKHQETVFRLSELLTLQVSIMGSLEMASLAFRRTDPQLADATQQTVLQARDVFQHGANVISGYAKVAHLVSDRVLKDIQLAVEENEPTMAVTLLGTVKEWVIKMRAEGEDIRRRYSQLQELVISLAKQAQASKKFADRHLMETAAALEADGKPARSRAEAAAQLDGSFALEVRNNAPPSGLSMCTGSPGRQPPRETTSTAAPSTTFTVKAQAPAQLNGLTQNLFHQLDALATDSALPVSDDQLEAWKENVLELLFLAPGAVRRPALPAPEDQPTSEEQDYEIGDASDDSEDGAHDDQGEESANAAVSDDGAIQQFNKAQAEKAEAAARSSAILLRALRELRRVDAILQGCSSFWANMDGTVQKLAQMKDHTEALVTFAANSVRLRQRFAERLKEYTVFWSSLEQICKQYCAEHHSMSDRMNRLIRDMAGAADLAETTESARFGVRRGGDAVVSAQAWQQQGRSRPD
jgi:uncharacterized protein YjiS (DUF1127 family)